MTSPAISGQKDAAGKTESSSTEETSSVQQQQQQQQEERPTPPLTAWYRVFKLANLLIKQGC